MTELEENDVRYIQSQFRQFPHFPMVCDLAKKYKITNDDVIEIVNRNPQIGAFIYRNSVYTWRHIRWFDYLIKNGTSKTDIMQFLQIGAGVGWKFFEQKRKDMLGNNNNMEDIMENQKKVILENKFAKEIAELTKRGLSQRAIAKEIGMSKSYVQSVQALMKGTGFVKDNKETDVKDNKKIDKKIDNIGKDKKVKTVAVKKESKADIPEVVVEVLSGENRFGIKIIGSGVKFVYKDANNGKK